MIHHGDLFDVLPTLEAESIDACVTDPPYDLTSNKRGGSGVASLNLNSPAGRSRITTGGGFMGKKWDGEGVAFRAETWGEVARVLKPGAHLLAFGGTRTFHRMTCAIEDAGFEIRDCLSWLYGQGFPKSLNLPNGLGTALKPSWEPIILARKPTHGTVAQNVQRHGTGAINIDACRIAGEPWQAHDATGLAKDKFFTRGETPVIHKEPHDLGRWPANVLLDEEAAMLLDEQAGPSAPRPISPQRLAAGSGDGTARGIFGMGSTVQSAYYDHTDKVSRFYYVAKPSREERDYGCDHLLARSGGEATDRKDGSLGTNSPRAGRTGGSRNIHPTVKPVELMRWLVRLVTPPSGVVLDPFLGSGTTGMACRYEGRRFVGIEREAEYVSIAEARIAAVAPLFGEETA